MEAWKRSDDRRQDICQIESDEMSENMRDRMLDYIYAVYTDGQIASDRMQTQLPNGMPDRMRQSIPEYIVYYQIEALEKKYIFIYILHIYIYTK